jgi:hypothetical protein
LFWKLLLNPWGNFDEAWYTGRSHRGDMHYVRGVLSIIFQGVTNPGFISIFCEKFFVFATPHTPFWDFDETLYKDRSHCRDVHILRGAFLNSLTRSYGR